MHILSWNLCRRRALPALPPFVAEYRPEVVLLQEASVPTEWQGESVGAAVTGQHWGSWVLATEGSLEPISLTGYEGWLAGAMWSHGSSKVACFSLHSPSGTDRSYVEESVAMVALIDEHVGRNIPLVIGGDFNFKSLGERSGDESLQTTAEERRALAEFRNRHFTLAWRSANQDAPLPQTLRWSGNKETPYHCDGLLVRNLAVSACDVLSTADIGFPSDHEPVLTRLAPTGAA